MTSPDSSDSTSAPSLPTNPPTIGQDNPEVTVTLYANIGAEPCRTFLADEFDDLQTLFLDGEGYRFVLIPVAPSYQHPVADTISAIRRRMAGITGERDNTVTPGDVANAVWEIHAEANTETVLTYLQRIAQSTIDDLPRSRAWKYTDTLDVPTDAVESAVKNRAYREEIRKGTTAWVSQIPYETHHLDASEACLFINDVPVTRIDRETLVQQFRDVVNLDRVTIDPDEHQPAKD